MKVYIVQSVCNLGEIILVTTDHAEAIVKKSEEFPDTFYIWEFDTKTGDLKRIDD